MDHPSPSKRDPQTYALIGAAIEVHRTLGCGFLEAVYQEALAHELADRGIPFRREVDLPVHYKGRVLACMFRVDFIAYEAVLLELKAVGELGPPHQAQVLNYLKATGFARALLFNFGAPFLEHKRFAGAATT
jgi:GxxExxY protein